MPEDGKYLYCIIKGDKPKKFEVKGVGGKDVYAICEGQLAAVVSDSEAKEYFIIRDDVITHQKVIEAVSQKYDVLPVSFGTVATDSQEIKEKILKPKAKEFLNALKEIEGKIELSLKVLWPDMNLVFQEIAKNSQTIQHLKKSQNINYKEKIVAGELVAKLLEERKETEKEKILGPLKKIADDLKENRIFGEDMILNAAFLVVKNKEKEFDKVVKALGKKFDQRIKFIYVGPLPPFNFVELHLKM